MSWEDHAEQILPFGAPRPQWLVARRAGVGGSDARVLMGYGYADESEFTVLQSKLLDLPERADNIRWRRGAYMEEFIAAEFEAVTGLHPERTGMWRNREQPWLLCNPDFRVGDRGLETKHVDNYGSAKAYRADETPPPRFYWQCVHCMATTGAESWWNVIDSPHYSDVLVFEISREDERVAADVELLTRREGDWWTNHVVIGFDLLGDQQVAPSVEPVADTVAEATLPELVRSARNRLAELKYPGTKAGKEEKKMLEALVKSQMGNCQVLAVDGEPMFRMQSRKNPGSLDKAGLEAEFPGALAKYTSSGGLTWHLAEITPTKESE